MNISLSQFCRDYGIAKTTAYRFCQEQNISVSEGLDPDAVALLKSEFNLDRLQVEPETEAVRPEVLPEGFWQTSELAPVERHEIQLPDSFDPAAMVRHFDGVMGTATDTNRLVQIAELAINSAVNAMEEKVDAQRAAFYQAQKDAKRLETMVSEAQTNMKIKSLESRLIAEQQTKQTAEAEAIFAQLMGLGKPVDG